MGDRMTPRPDIASMAAEEVDAAIARLRQEHYHVDGNFTMVVDCANGRCLGGETMPFPYCASWEHAGPLFEEMGGWVRSDGDEWAASPDQVFEGEREFYGKKPTDAISRSWLAANWGEE